MNSDDIKAVDPTITDSANGVYSNIQILQAYNDGHLVCVPFNPKHISHASLDVTLGYHYYRIKNLDQRFIYNPFDVDDVVNYFDGPYKALPFEQWAKTNYHTNLKGIPKDHPVIILAPGERILAHTHEFVGIRPPGGITLHSRSSWGRNGVAVCFDAGWVDPGYINRLTLEIYNLNQDQHIVLPVGERIAQAIIHHTGPVNGNYGDGRDNNFSGKYQQGTDLQILIKTWTPQQMLPQAYRDSRQLPPKIEGLLYE